MCAAALTRIARSAPAGEDEEGATGRRRLRRSEMVDAAAARSGSGLDIPAPVPEQWRNWRMIRVR